MTDWLDFKTTKRGVTMDSLLREYRVELRRCGKDQYRGRCPIHGGQGPEAFHVNLARNIFHCFSCGAGGTVLDFVAAMEGCTLREAAGKLSRLAPVNPVPANNKKLVTQKRSEPAPLRFRLRNIDSAHPYLASRGISNHTALDFGVGFYPGPGLLSRRLVIPIHNFQGQLVAYCGRSLDGTQPRYRFPPRFAKSRTLFNYHRAAATPNKTVVIVEGFFDCLKVYQAGIHSVVALMGVALYEAPRQAIVDRFTQVALMLDGDAAGQAATRTIADSLRTSCSVELVRLPAGVQPDQLSEELISNLLRTALPDLSSAR
ncbi:MAG TPA: CHC2 zinc finger domain-containing protein [Blastocatellia bacterium]|nr:CHC2 zinc finger domain-containing protein [Blastocatellia bacterium]